LWWQGCTARYDIRLLLLVTFGFVLGRFDTRRLLLSVTFEFGHGLWLKEKRTVCT
jgi:hypothetical protein